MKQNYAKIISGFILAGLLTFSSCQSTHEMAKTDYQIAKVEGRMIDIDAKWDTHPDADAVAILKPYKEKIDNMMYEVIGSSEQKMDKGHPESLLSNLVAEVLRQAATKVQDKPADMGLVNMGGLRNILPAGDIAIRKFALCNEDERNTPESIAHKHCIVERRRGERYPDGNYQGWKITECYGGRPADR